MKPILFALSILIAGNAAAQSFSAGARTGASYWPSTTNNIEIVEGNSGFSWEKSAYGRYESKGRFAFEVNVAHCSFAYKYIKPNWDYFEAPPYEFLDHRSKTHVFTGNVLAQVRVTNTRSKVKSYFGTGLSYGRRLEKHQLTVQYYSTKAISEKGWADTYHLVFCGLNNYTSYKINQHINVHSAVSFDIDPFDALSGFRPSNRFPESRLSCTIGCGYTF
jgi:hypothetical protein